MKPGTLAALACTVVAAVACGGGSGGNSLGSAGPQGTTAGSNGPGVPSAVLSGVDSFIAYVRQLTPDEASEPLTLPGATFPTSDTTEPSGV